MRSSAPQSALVRITRVTESKTRRGDRRFLIEAERVNSEPCDRFLSLTTLNQWIASVCDQAWKAGLSLSVMYRDTGYFDKDLMVVKRPPVLVNCEVR